MRPLYLRSFQFVFLICTSADNVNQFILHIPHLQFCLITLYAYFHISQYTKVRIHFSFTVVMKITSCHSHHSYHRFFFFGYGARGHRSDRIPPPEDPSESSRYFAASMDESVIIGDYTLKKCRSPEMPR